MYYKKCKEIPSLPTDIKQQLIQVAEQNQQNNISMSAWYSGYQTVDTNSLSFVEFDKRFQESNCH